MKSVICARKKGLNSEALDIIREIKGPLAVVAVTGLPQTGKSYLLNRMLLNRKQGFLVGGNDHSEIGLTIWGKPVLGQTSKLQTISILVIDSNLGGLIGDEAKRLALLQPILSSVLLYNCLPPLDNATKQNFLEMLSSTTKLANFDSPVSLFCVLRDSTTDSPSVQQMTRMVKTTQHNGVFETREVIALTRPVSSQAVILDRMDDIDYESLSPDFVDQLIQARRRILNNVSPKVVNGKVFDGVTWLQMLISCVDELNSSHKIPRLSMVWQKVCEAECQAAKIQAIELYRHRYREVTLSKKPISEQAVELAYTQAKLSAVELMNKRCVNNNFLPEWLGQLKLTLKSQLKETLAQNSKENLETTKEFLSFEYQTIERKLRTRELKTIQDYRKEMLLFHEFYKKKGNSSIVGRDYYHEFVMRKIYEGTAIILGYMSEDAEEKIKVLSDSTKRMEAELKQARQSTYKEKSQIQSKIDKLLQQNSELTAREQALDEAIQDIKIQKETVERSYVQQIAREKSEYSRSLQQLRSKLTICQNKLQECERNRVVLESELRKKEVLYAKSFENYEGIIGEHKTMAAQFVREKEQLMAKADSERRLVEIKLENKTKECLSLIKQYTIKLQESQDRADALAKQLGDLKEHSELQSIETKQTVQSLQNLKKQLQLECKIYQKKINENKQKTQRLNRQQQQLRVLSDELRKVSEELKTEKAEKQKIKAILEQKQQFVEIELKDERNKARTLEERLKQIMATTGDQNNKLQLSNSQLKEEVSDLRKLTAQLKEQVVRQTSQLGTLNKKLEEKDQQLMNYLKFSKEREEAMEASKTVLLQQMRSSDIERVRLVKLSDIRNTEQVDKFKQEIEIMRQMYKEQLQQLKNSSEESLRQLKNFHSLEKERLESRLMEERARNEKKTQSSETETLRKLREASHKYQQDVLQLKRQLWEDEKNYKSEINRLEYQLSQKKTELDELKNKKLLSPRNKDDNNLQLQILNHKMQDLTTECNNKNNELKAVTTQKDKLEQLLKIREETARLSKQSQQNELISNRQLVQQLARKYEIQHQRAKELEVQLTEHKQNAFVKSESLLTQNRFLLDKVTFQTKERQQIRNSHDLQVNRIKKHNAESLRSKLIDAEKELDCIQDKYEQARRCLLQMESAHSKQLSRLEGDKRLLQSRLDSINNHNSSLLYRRLKSP